MKIFEEKGYKYQKHLFTGGEGEIHLIKSVDTLYVAKIYDKLDENSFNLLNNLKSKNIPNIPKIHELFNHEDKTILIRDYVEGETLKDVLDKQGPFGYIKAKSIIIKICDTLSYLHNMQPNPIIYRDLKPENIIITPQNDVRVIDFGIARYHKAESTRDTILAGTKGYTAPEVLSGMQSDNRSDIYSAGLLFYEMLTGLNLLMPPFQIRPVAESDDKLEKWLDTIIAKATDFNQTMRYKCIEDFIYDLEHPHKINRQKNIKTALIAFTCAIAAVVLVYSAYQLFFADNSAESSEAAIEAITENTPQDSYSSLLELTFDDESDEDYILAFDDLGSEYEISQGRLNVINQACEIDFLVENGMFIHYRAMGSEMATVGLGAYNVTMFSRFECSFYDTASNTDYAAWDLKMQGAPVKSDENYIDILLYTNEENTAVYAIVLDENSTSAAYMGYKINEEIGNTLYLDVCNFKYTDSDYIYLDYVNVLNGSIKTYLKDNFSAYNTNKEAIDNLLDKDIDELKEIPIEVIDY